MKLAAFTFIAAGYLSFGQSCKKDLWIADSLGRCAPDDTIAARTELVADEECRAFASLTEENSRQSFPGYYRATCGENIIVLSVFGNRDSSCVTEPIKTVGIYLNREGKFAKEEGQPNEFSCMELPGLEGSSSPIILGVYGSFNNLDPGSEFADKTISQNPAISLSVGNHRQPKDGAIDTTSTAHLNILSFSSTLSYKGSRKAAAHANLRSSKSPGHTVVMPARWRRQMQGNEMSLVYTIGLPFGVVMVVVGAMFVCFTALVSRRKRGRRTRSKPTSLKSQKTSSTQQRRNTSRPVVAPTRDPRDGEFEVEPHTNNPDEYSSLGGLTFLRRGAGGQDTLSYDAENAPQSTFEDRTATIRVNYDYENAMQPEEPRDSSTSGTSTTAADAEEFSAVPSGFRQWLADFSLVNDASSLEQHFAAGSILSPTVSRSLLSFEVDVPPGELGIHVTFVPGQGAPPVVRDIQEDSVLCDKVRVGDMLLFIDEHYLTILPGPEVARVVSQCSQEIRHLGFLRIEE